MLLQITFKFPMQKGGEEITNECMSQNVLRDCAGY